MSIRCNRGLKITNAGAEFIIDDCFCCRNKYRFIPEYVFSWYIRNVMVYVWNMPVKSICNSLLLSVFFYSFGMVSEPV